jgi:hypothetical protein
MTDMPLHFNSASLVNRLGAFLYIRGEPWILFLNPVKIVKFIRKRASDMNRIAKPRPPAF